MDSHFEVILERVKNLTSESKKTVWFEVHTAVDGTPVLVLIGEDNRIGLINVNYTEDIPTLFATKLSKESYELFLQQGHDIDIIKSNRSNNYNPAEVVGWISKN